MQITPFSEIPLEPYQGILIDLDNTLYEYEPAHQAGLKASYNALPYDQAFDAFAVTYRQARNKVTADLAPQASCRSRLLAFQAIAEEKKINSPYSCALMLEAAYWDSFIEKMPPDPEALAFLARAKEATVPVCIVSDMTTTIQIRKIQKLGIEPLINGLVTSEEVGIEKPDPRMFNAGLQKLGLSAQDTVMIGDHPEKDIEGAKALGITCFLVQLNEGNK